MSEWLTFGQLLDKMRVGDIAESEEKEGATFGHYYVQRYDNGFYVWDGKEVDEKNHFHFMKLETCYFYFKWRILPRCVSFEEAMKAYAEGKNIVFYPAGNEECNPVRLPQCYRNYVLEDLRLGEFSLLELVNGKWTIEE